MDNISKVFIVDNIKNLADIDMCMIFLMIINKTIDISDNTDIDKHLIKKMI